MTCCGSDPRFVGDPIDVVTGAFIEDTKDFEIADDNAIVWRRLYSSRDIAIDRGFGIGHSHSFDHRLKIHLDGISYAAPSGTTVEFPAFTETSPRVSARGYVLHRRGRELAIETPTGLSIVFEMGSLAEARPVRVGDVRLGYDPAGRLHSLSNSQESLVVLTWDAAHIVAADGKRTTDPRPTRLASYRYENNRLTDFQDAYGATVRYAHDAEGRVVARADRTGYKFGFRYDVDGRCVHSAAQDGVLEVKLEYFPLERRTKVTKGDGGVWEYFYNEVGTLLTIVDAEGGTRTFVPRESDGQIGSETDGAGNEYFYEYDADGGFIAKRDALRRVVREEPDHRVPSNLLEFELGLAGELPLELPAREVVGASMAGRPAAAHLTFATAPGAGRLTKVFDLQGRLLREERDGRARQHSYDAGGNSVWIINLDGVRRDFEVSSFFQLRGERDANGHATRLEYTTENEISAVVDAGGTRTQFARNKRSELTGVARAGAVKERYLRDGAGRIIQKDGPTGPRYTIKLGPQGEVLERLFASGGFERLEYDHLVRLVGGETTAGKSTFAYDSKGNCLVDELDGVGVRRRTSGGRTTEVTVLDRFRTQYEAIDRAAGFEITDPTGNRHRVLALGGGIFVRESGARTETTQYHPDGRCLHRIVEGASGPAWIRSFDYTPEGFLLARHDSQRGTSRYRHDAAQRVVAEELPGSALRVIEHDRAGNILQNGPNQASYFQGNVLGAANGKAFTHDASQAISSETSAGRARHFLRDERDQLVMVRNFARTAPDAPWEETASWSAQYDVLSRRVSKTYEGRTTRYVWDSDQLAAEIHPDGRVRVYVYADALALTPLLFVDYENADAEPESGTVYVVFANQLGCPERIERLDGSIVWSATFSAYGEASIDVGADFHQPLRWPGHYFDGDLALHYNRFRNYSPELGRYLEPDPIGRGGGLENVYAYTRNPLKFVDVDGLCPVEAAEQAEKDARKKARKDAEDEVKRLKKDPNATPKQLAAARRKRYEAQCAAKEPPTDPLPPRKWGRKSKTAVANKKQGEKDEAGMISELGLKDNNRGKNRKQSPKLDENKQEIPGKSGKPKLTRPDGVNNEVHAESKSVDASEPVVIKDTDQTRGQRAGAAKDGKEHAVVVSSKGDRDNVSPDKGLEQSNVLHRDTSGKPPKYSKWNNDTKSWDDVPKGQESNAAAGLWPPK